MSICAKKDYEFIDEATQNAYNTTVVKAVLIDAIENTYNIKTLSVIAKQVFGYDCQIVRWWDDDGFGLAYPKDSDAIQKHLADMAIRNLCYKRSEQT
jgi:hypothetical protein